MGPPTKQSDDFYSRVSNKQSEYANRLAIQELEKSIQTEIKFSLRLFASCLNRQLAKFLLK